MKRLSKLLATSLILGIGIMTYVNTVQRECIKIREVKVKSSSKDLVGIKIAYFTDTHYNGEKSNVLMDKVLEEVNKLNADIIIFTGDLVDYKYALENDTSKVVDILSHMKAKYGKYAVYGNHDRNNGREIRYNQILKDSGFELLVNEEKVVEVGESKISLIGLDDYLLGDFENTPPSKESDYSIVLAHEPDIANELDKSKYDLQLSGHTHGGQVRLPFIGRISKVRGGIYYDKGMYALSDRMGLYVSSGIGNSRLDIRVGNVPEIVMIELT